MNVIASAFLDTRRKKKDNTYPLKLRIMDDRKRHYYPLLDISESDWKKIEKGKYLSDYQRSVQIKVSEAISKAQKAIDDLEIFSKTAFENLYYNRLADDPTLKQAFDHKIQKLKENNQIGSKQAYETAKSSLVSFFSDETRLTEITLQLLNSYEESMVSKGKSINTVSLYLRNLRHLFHLFNIPQKHFPFGKNKYQISKKSKLKDFLSKEDINRIFKYDLSKHDESFAYYVSLWKFSFLTQGAQIADIVRLRNKDVKKEEIHFYRRKTQRTRRTDLKPIVCPVHEKARKIIDTYRNDDKSPDAYLFPFLTGINDEEKQKQKIHTLRKCINKRMEVIRVKLGIEMKIITASSRDAYANLLYQNGQPIGLIGEALGHTDPKTTMNYIAGFNHDKKLKTYDGIFT